MEERGIDAEVTEFGDHFGVDDGGECWTKVYEQHSQVGVTIVEVGEGGMKHWRDGIFCTPVLHRHIGGDFEAHGDSCLD